MGDSQTLADCNWNRKYQDDGVSIFYLTDFALTQDKSDGTRELTSLLLDSPGNTRLKYTLSGNLLNSKNPNKIRHRVSVNSYYIDVGSIGSNDLEDQSRGFWMVGDDEDIKYKLLYPAAAEYAVYAAGILDLAKYSNLTRFYYHSHETMQCIRMTDFSLTDRASGSKQTPILPKIHNKSFVLKGSISANLDRLAGSDITAFIGITDKARCRQLQMQTYIKSTYVVDFGREQATSSNPILWMEDAYKTWIKLEAPCHRDYEADYNVAMDRTINNVDAYDWAADPAEVWRHVTNFRLTNINGQAEQLEITGREGVFILWGDLQPPPGSLCPPIPIKLYVTNFSMDTGKTTGDPEQGVWMQEVKGGWYKLVLPAAPDYTAIAAPLFRKASKFQELFDALVFQDISEKYCNMNEDDTKYVVTWPLRRIHRVVNPKFDLEWARQSRDFVLEYLQGDFDLAASRVFVDSFQGPDIHVDAPQERRPQLVVREKPAPVEKVAMKEKAVVSDKLTKEKAASDWAEKLAAEKARVERAESAKQKSAAQEKEREREKEKEKVVAASSTSSATSSTSSARPNMPVAASLSFASILDPPIGKKRSLESASVMRSAEETARAASARAQKVTSLFGNSITATDSNTARAPGAPGWESAVAAKPIKKKQMIPLDTLSPSAVGATSGRAATIDPAAPAAAPLAKKARIEELVRAPISVSVMSSVTPVFRTTVDPIRSAHSASSTASTSSTSSNFSAANLPGQSPRAPILMRSVSSNSSHNGSVSSSVLQDDRIDFSHQHNSERDSHFSAPVREHMDRRDGGERHGRDRDNSHERLAAAGDSYGRDRSPREQIALVESDFPCTYCKQKIKRDKCHNTFHHPGKNFMVRQTVSADPLDERDHAFRREQNGSRDRESRYFGGDTREGHHRRNESNELIEGTSMCTFCQGKIKLSACNNTRHINGQNLQIYSPRERDDRPRHGDRETSASRDRNDAPPSSSHNRPDSYYDRDYLTREEAEAVRDWKDEREVVEGDQLCNFCYSKKKREACRVPRHTDGQFMWIYKTHRDKAPRSDDFSSDRHHRSDSADRAGDHHYSSSNATKTPVPVAHVEDSEGAGRGRGKASTLPAWMTSGFNAEGTSIHSGAAPVENQFMDVVDTDDNSLAGGSERDFTYEAHTKMVKAATKPAARPAEIEESSAPAAKRSRFEADGAFKVSSRAAISAGSTASSDREAGEVSDDSSDSPPSAPLAQLTVPEVLSLVHVEQTASAPPPRISAPAGASVPPPKPSRFANEGAYKVASTKVNGVVDVQEVNIIENGHKHVIAAVRAPEPPLPEKKTLALNNAPIPSANAPAVVPPAAKVSRFVADGNLKVSSAASSTATAAVVGASSVTQATPSSPRPSTMSILNGAVKASTQKDASATSTVVPPQKVPTGTRPTQAGVGGTVVSGAPAPVPTSASVAAPKPISNTISAAPVAVAEADSGNAATELSRKVTSKDEMSLERSKYEKKHHTVESYTGEDYLSKLLSTGNTGKPKWGALLPARTTTPVTPHGAGELVRLGSREEDPKARLAQSSRNAGSVYKLSSTTSSGATTSSVVDSSASASGSGSGEGFIESAGPMGLVVVDLKAQPTKSALRNTANMNGTKNNANNSNHCSINGATARNVAWLDAHGGYLSRTRLIDKAVYSTDSAMEAPPPMQLAYPSDADGNVKVLWNESQSP